MAFPSELSQVARALNYDKQGDVSQVSISATVGVTSVGIGTTLPRYTLEVGAVGAAGTQLYVNGDARVIGILSVGSGTITLDPNENKITVGTAATIDSDGFRIGTSLLHSTGIEADQFNVGLLTATTFQVNQQTVTNMSVTGVITASSAEFSGNVSIGGTLTYQDVINVDAIGIATARSGLRITGGGLDVVGVATFNNGVDTLDVIGHAEVDQLRVSGVSTFTGNIDANGDLDVDGHTELDNVNISGIVTAFELDVDGHTELDNVNISGVSTFVGITTVQSTLFANQLSVAGVSTFTGNIDANGDLDVDGHTELDNVNISGVSTFASAVDINASIDVDGHTELDDLNVSGVSTFTGAADFNGDIDVDGHTELDNLNVSGVSTFVGIGTFQNDLYVGGALYVSRSTLGDDIETRNLNVSGVSTFTGAIDANGDLDVDGHTELDNVNIAGVLTATSATFSGDVTVGGTLTYEDVVNVDAIGIATARSGLRITGGGLDVVGVSTFNNNIDLNADLDVDGHTELDNVNIAGVLTATSATFSGDLTVGGVLKYEDVVNVDSVGIATARSGLRITDGGLDVVGVSTFNNNIDLNADLDVDGHTELDALNVSGVATATRFDGDLNALGKTYYVSITGSDSNSGDNINEPYLTIAQALSVAADGDIINVSSGTYEETVPLTVPRGVTLKGAGLRSTTIKPTDATKTNNILLLNDLSTVEDFTIKDGFYNSTDDTGYVFSYATGIAITTRSPYVQRVTVLNKGSSTSFTDPYGYDTADSPPTSYIAGRGALIDGSKVASNSLEAGMLFNEVTFFTPNNAGVVLTNGARAEYLNCFHYFSSQAIVGTSGTVGIAGTAEARLKFRTPSVTPSINDVVKLFDSGGSVVAVGTITNYDDPYAKISGKGYGTFTSVGIGTTQRVEFYQSDGTTFTGIASAISFADYTMFGAEMRSVGCAVEYGSQGVVADGVGVQLRLFAMNFNHVGSGKDMSNDPTTVIQANEVVELNNGQVSYVSIDQGGDFRVGDSLYINQETGQVSFASTSYDLENVGNLVVTDGGSNQTLITPTSLTVGNLQLAANTFSSTSGDITIDPGGSSETNITGNLNVSGILTASVLQVSALQKGDTSISLDDTGSDGTIRFNTDGSEAFRINNQQVSVFTGDIDLNADIDVDGHTELDNVNVSGFLTAANATITGDLSVLGNLTYEDVTDVDSVGLATARAGLRITGGGLDVVGVATFNDNVYLGDNDRMYFGANTDLQIYHDGSNSYVRDNGFGSLILAGDEIEVQNSSLNETKAVFTTNGAAELYYDNSKKFETATSGVNIVGTTTTGQLSVTGVSTFQGNVDLGDDDRLRFGAGQDLQIYHDSATNSSYINESGSGRLEIRGSDLYLADEDGTTMLYAANNAGVSLYYGGGKTFETTAGGIDVTGHAEVDQLRVSGVSTFQSNVNLGDDDRLYFGGGNDLEIYHNSAIGRNYIDSNADIWIRSRVNESDIYVSAYDDLFLRVANGENAIIATGHGSVDLYYDNSKKFETTGAGVTVTGTTFSNQLGVSGISTFSQGINAEGYVAFRGDTYTASWISSPGYFSLPDSSYVTFGSSQDLTIKHDGTNSSITNREGDLIIETTTAGEGPGGDDIVIKSRDDFEVQVAGGTTAIYATGGGSVVLTHDGSTKFETTAGGIDVTGHTELDNVNVSGVLTATSAEFSGNVTVLGDLTYENVTNQDSIGIATARAGLRVTGGGLDVVGVSTFNNNVSVAGTFGVTGLSYFQDRIEVHATGGSNRTSLSSDALIFNGSGDLTIKNNTTSGDILFTTKSSTLAKFFSGGAIELYHNNNKTLETTGVGVTITGGLDANGSINSSTDVQIDGVSVLTTASDEAIALAIALG